MSASYIKAIADLKKTIHYTVYYFLSSKVVFLIHQMGAGVEIAHNYVREYVCMWWRGEDGVKVYVVAKLNESKMRESLDNVFECHRASSRHLDSMNILV